MMLLGSSLLSVESGIGPLPYSIIRGLPDIFFAVTVINQRRERHWLPQGWITLDIPTRWPTGSRFAEQC
jgi:hypothetical protein